MTIQEAIRIKKEYHPMIQRLGVLGLYEAHMLGLEALKRLEQDRELHFVPKRLLLPGETKE